MEAKQTPLIDLLERVPQDARVVVEHDQFSSSSHPVGRLCHEAAAELRRLHAQAAQDEALLRQALEALEISTRFVYADMRPQCEDAIAALRERLDEGEQR